MDNTTNILWQKHQMLECKTMCQRFQKEITSWSKNDNSVKVGSLQSNSIKSIYHN